MIAPEGIVSRPVLETLPRDRNEPFSLPASLMDDLTYNLVQMPDLLGAVDTSVTRTGSLVLERSFRQPPTSLDLIRAKQEAVQELGSNNRLRYRVEEYLHRAASMEADFYTYFHGDYAVWPPSEEHHNLYTVYKESRRFMQFLTEGVDGVQADSNYLSDIFSGLRDFSGKDIYNWVKNPLYRNPRLTNGAKTSWFMPRWKFLPTDYKPDYYAAIILMSIVVYTPMSFLLLSIGSNDYPDIGSRLLDTLKAATFSGSLMGSMMACLIPLMGAGRMMDDSLFVKPVANRYFKNADIAEIIDNLGKLDEILTFVKYGERVNGSTVLPHVTDDPVHHFSARNLRNPLMVIGNPDYVPNDVDLDGAKLTFLTGHNSGGKTSLCKSIAQAQILAQNGAPIPAEATQISIADRVSYQAPMINSLKDTEGRFGTEIIRARDIFFQTTPRSLVMLDELIEATTYEERLKHSQDILEGFWHIGNNTVLVTHNHQLVEHFRDLGMGQCLQVEFDGRTPTHKFVPGISKESHADEVMKSLGFTREDIFGHLRDIGYIQ
ncbi:MAG: DNA mismatch repair protein MutS-like protein [Microgenomates group bacterium Gr01-1014_7]|nr:MAG: DNA mismatch repair protein MutS-like protein [Microgenomates group bacterium Gr01-1014_7]